MSMATALAALAALQDPFAWADAADKAEERARKDGRLVVLYFTAASCGWSRKLERETFAAAPVSEALSKGFAGARIDVDAQPQAELARRFKVHGTPHVVIATPDLAFVSQMIGYRDAAAFRDWLDRVVALAAKVRETESAVQAAPKDAGLRRALGDHHRDLGNLPAAIAAYETSARISGEKPNPTEEERRFRGETLVRLSDAYRSDNRPAALADVAQELLALDPKGKLGFRDNALYLLALHEHSAALQENKPERSKKALAYLREAADEYPESDKADEILLWLAVLYSDLEGNKPAAEAALRRLIEKHPQSPLAEFAKKALEQLKQPEKR
jgi:tetratricopeptide (TPR) repeat protein